MCYTYKTATFWNKLEIDVITEEIPENPQTVGQWLKYHRTSSNLTRIELSSNLEICKKTIEKIEENIHNPSPSMSKKLATFFKLDTIYFYDSFYENYNNTIERLKQYRIDNNLSYWDIDKRFGLRYDQYEKWENGTLMKRKTYEKLKKLGIL